MVKERMDLLGILRKRGADGDVAGWILLVIGGGRWRFGWHDALYEISGTDEELELPCSPLGGYPYQALPIRSTCVI